LVARTVRSWRGASAAVLLLASLPGVALAQLECLAWTRVDLETQRLLPRARTSLQLSLPERQELADSLAQTALQRLPGAEPLPVLRIDVSSRALGRESQLSSWFERDALQVLQNQRLDTVRYGRFKRRQFSAIGVQEEQRRGDAHTQSLAPQHWRLKRQQLTDVPEGPAYVDEIAVLLLAGSMVMRGDSQLLQRVYADGRLLDVLLEQLRAETLSLRYTRREHGTETRHRQVESVLVRISVSGAEDQAAGFELLGLNSPLLLHVDAQSGAPLRLGGRNDRLGNVSIAATRVEIAERKTEP